MNLLEETLRDLMEHGKTEADILYVRGSTFKVTWENFKQIAKETEYDDGYGAQKVATDLMIVGKDFWMERYEYDGSENWVYKEYPKDAGLPFKEIHALTVDQAKCNVCCGWESLATINGY